MKNIKTFESFVKESVEINEMKAGIPKMFLKHGAVINKIRELEDKQKELSKPYFKAKADGDDETMKSQLVLMQKNQKELASRRANLAEIEDKYVNNSEMPWDKE
jgi:hypothetical protein